MKATPTVLCKSGAEGYHATCMIAKHAGMAVKVVDGNDRAVSPFVVNALIAEGVVLNNQASRLEQHRCPPIVNHAHQTVGEITYLDGQ
jgi:L-asparaginase II